MIFKRKLKNKIKSLKLEIQELEKAYAWDKMFHDELIMKRGE